MKFEKKKSKSKYIFVIVIILVIVCIIIGFNYFSASKSSDIARGSVVTFDSIKNGIGAFFGGFSDYFSGVENLSKKNEELVNKNKELEYKLMEINRLEKEVLTLKERLDIKEAYKHFELKYASVVARDYDNWNETFIINAGSSQGIEAKMTVISKDGLVGYVKSVTETTAVVTTILDPTSSVSSQINTVLKPSLCTGDFELKQKKQLKLINIPIDSEVSTGDMVYTSGIGEIYQKGIAIGKIIEVKNKKNDMNRYAIVEPFADIVGLTEVAIITK